MVDMNERQRIAYNSPITRSVDTLNRRYGKDFRLGKLRLSSILTLSLMDKDPTWHVSISVLDRRQQPTPIERVPEASREAILQKLNDLLSGVGDEERSTYTESETAFHLIRPLTVEEKAGLSSPRHQAHNN
jgi:hypothetical protein